MAEYRRPIATIWYRGARSCIQSATGTAHLSLLATLMGGAGIGGRARLSQFIYGFPTAGASSRRHTFAATSGNLPTIRDLDFIFNDAERRFRDGAKHPDPNDAVADWGEIVEKMALRWADGLLGLTDSGIPASDPESMINIAFGPPISRHVKTRACEDCENSNLNDFCAIKTPVSLPSWGHIHECVREITSSNLSLSSAVYGRESAYKCAPLRPGSISICVLAVWAPARKCFPGAQATRPAFRFYRCRPEL